MRHNSLMIVAGLIMGLGLPGLDARADQTTDQASTQAWSQKTSKPKSPRLSRLH